MQLRAASIVSLVAIIVPLMTACNDDGRTLRPATPGQVGSVSTLAPVTEPTDLNDGTDQGVGDGLNPVPIASSPGPAEALVVSSSFEDGGPIPVEATCQGENLSPILTWSPAPDGTVEIAITMEDLDAPGFVHWAIAGIDPESLALGEGDVPEQSVQGMNGTGEPGYTGPCPPVGETHTYRITVHYLNRETELADGAPGADMIESIDGATLASASTTGTYSQS